METNIERLRYIFLGMLCVTRYSPSHCQVTPDSKQSNILCILVDDLGYGDLSCQGAPDMQTPNIDNLARQGITFSNFYANCTVSSPSRASLLSGMYPDMVGVPGVIRQNIANNWGYLAENTPNEKGFDYFKGFLGDMMDDYRTHLRGGINWMRLNDKEIDPDGHATDIFTDWTIEYLNERKKADRPFFLYLAYNAPHFPIQPPQEWLDIVKKRESDITDLRAKNVALIEHLDFSIGRILNTLEETGLLENTLLVFTSDNGGSLRHGQSNGKLRGGKQDMYEGGIRVPAFVYWKNRIVAGSKTDNFAMLMDLFPTFCEVAGVKVVQSTDGISILPTLLGKSQITNDRFVFWVRREGGNYRGQAYYAARYKEYKILQNTPFEPVQYFNLKDDEYEANPLDPSESKVFSALRMELQNHIRRSGMVPWQKRTE